MKIAIYPGSFDPITLGHINIIQKSEKIFDKIIIGIGENNKKTSFFSTEKKFRFIKKIFAKNKNISVARYNSLTTDFCKLNSAKFIIRGIRNTNDFEIEKQLATMNEELEKTITTIFIPCSKNFNEISSSLVKELIINKGPFEKFVPKEIIHELKIK